MIWEELEQELDRLQRDGLQRRRRTLEGPCGPLARVDGRTLISFCSNDYLGLSAHPALIEAACTGARAWGVGSGASHLVSGHLTPHAELEAKLADFVGFPRALLFSTGYMANLGIVPALLGRADAVFADRLNHASLIDAAQLARADHQRYPHCDLAALERLLANSQAKRKLILTDAVFSMDGDLAPVPQLLALAERYDAWLYLDDAHGFGVLGPQGQGSLAHWRLQSPRLIYMATLGKAAGVAGACVAGSASLIDWLVNAAHTYLYTTAQPPLLAEALLQSVELIEAEPWRRERLATLIAQLRQGCVGLPWRLLPSSTPIQPLMVGSSEAALALADGLRQKRLWVPAIRPPTVPDGQARLRISLSAAHTTADVAQLAGALHQLAAGWSDLLQPGGAKS